MKRVLFFLGQLDDRDIEWMTNNGQKLDISHGTTLIQKGKSIDHLYIILSGKFKIYSNNGEDLVATLGSGEILGEMSFLESRPPSVSVIATEDSQVYAISKETIYLRMLSYPEFKGNFYYSLALFLSNRLRKTTDQLGYGNPEEEDLVDLNILANVSQAGSRFGHILHKFSEV